MKRGYIQLYTGDGKGKTTASAGLALRALGNGMRVLFVQFMKGTPSGEIAMFEKLAGIRVLRDWDNSLVIVKPNAYQHEMCDRLWRRAREAALRDPVDLLVLDEIAITIYYGLLKEDEVLAFLADKPEQTEIVMTGQMASQKLMDTADLVTQMTKIKHYYDINVTAREGIEY